MKVKVNDIIAINLSLYILYILNPFVTWLFSNAILNLFFIATSLVIFFLPGKNHEINTNKKIILVVLIFFLIYLYTPLFGHELNIGRLMKFTPLLIMLFYNQTIFSKAYLNVYQVMVFISLFSIIVFIISNIGIDLPHIRIVREQRLNTSDYYRLYGIVVELYRGSTPISSLGLSQACGAFTEPGHYGIFLGLFLLAEKLNFKKKGNVILLIAGLFTLSAAFVFILLLGIFYNYFSKNKITAKNISLTILIISTGLFFVLSDTGIAQMVRYAIYERHFQGVNSITDIRTSQVFIVEFNRFLQSDNVFWGYKGTDISEIIERQSNFTAFIFRYGFIAIGLCIILILTMLNIIRNQKIYYLSFLLAVLLVLGHRYWMLTEPTIYGLLLIIIQKKQ
jgi:hypothetical protein